MTQPLYDNTTTADLMADIQSQLQDRVPTLQSSIVVDQCARYLRWNFENPTFDNLDVLQITDIQFGHKQCDTAKLNEYIGWVNEEENRYVLLGGDLVDAGHQQSKGSPFEQIGDPQEEVWKFCRMLAPIRHRILGYVGGNHERRSLPTFGDIGKSISIILRLPYSPGKQHIDIVYGDHKPFRISMFHGGGSAQTTGAIAMNLERWMTQSDSQLYLLGHLHKALTISASREIRDGNGGMALQKVIGARGSSFLKHYGTYAEVIMGTAPVSILMPKLRLYRDKAPGHENPRWEVNLR